MKTLLYVLTYVYATKCATIKTTTNISENLNIEELEKQKGELYTQINSAIQDTIQTLSKTNDTEAKEGITYMKELMKQIKEFNDTDLTPDEDSANNSSEGCSDENPNKMKLNNNTDFIGSGRRKQQKPEYTGYEKIKEYIANSGHGHKLGPVTGEGNIKVESKKKKARLEKYLEMQQKLAKWKEARDLEKQKVREYKARLQIVKLKFVTEKCPDFGESKPKTGKGLDKLPCCRKCCKKSYMGCLK